MHFVNVNVNLNENDKSRVGSPRAAPKSFYTRL